MDPTLFEGLFAEILAPLVNGTFEGMNKKAKAKWAKVDSIKAARSYKDKLSKRHGTIQILGQPRPQNLGKVYTDVYLHEKPTHSYAMQVEKLEEMFQEHNKRFGRVERTDGLAFAKAHEWLFILGKPGAGKTTFLKYLTMQAVEGDIPLIPIFVSLNDFQHRKIQIVDYLAEQFDVCDFPNARLFIELLLLRKFKSEDEREFKKGYGLILLDGLDEISKERDQREQITRQLKAFIDKFDRNHFALTCRIAASDYKFQGFDYVEMADFTDHQVKAFVCRWFLDSQPKIDGFLKELEKSDNEGIKEMTTSPLLLTLLCIQYDGSMALPPSRSEIYEEALEVLLKTWDGHRDINRGDLIVADEDQYKALTFKRKMQLMSRLAFGTFKEGKLFIEQKWLEDSIVKYLGKIPKGPDPDLVDGSVVLKAMESQHGLLVERASRIYSFSHLTLQEYFTAKYIVDHAKDTVALSILVSADKITDPRWREVFLFVAELLPAGDNFVVWFAETLQVMGNEDPLKLLVSWVENRTQSRPFARRQLVSRINFLTSASYIARAAASIENKRPLVHFRQLADSSILADSFYKLRSFASVFAEPQSSIQSRTRIEIPKRAYFDLMKFAINEGLKLEWPEFSDALSNLYYSEVSNPNINWSFVWRELIKIEQQIILNDWVWETMHNDDAEYLILWLEGHELLFDCLDRVVLESLDRETFADKYLYRLPPNARPQLGDGA